MLVARAGWRGQRLQSILRGMSMPPSLQTSRHAPPEPPIEVRAGLDGRILYVVHLPPEELPAVRKRDLAAAWEQAHQAALAGRPGAWRALRLRSPDGGSTDLALEDRDARCWAEAVDRDIGLHTSYGISLCLRLLALVDLLAHAGWAGSLLRGRGDAVPHPELFRLAASASLSETARFDPVCFQKGLGHLRALAGKPTGARA